MTDARLSPQNEAHISTHGAIFSPGTTRELINFSTHSGDTERFHHDWSAVTAYVQRSGLDGLELLLGYEAPPVLPPGLVQAVHLPFWLTWLDIWRGATMRRREDATRRRGADGCGVVALSPHRLTFTAPTQRAALRAWHEHMV